jgi:hypothetical protein
MIQGVMFVYVSVVFCCPINNLEVKGKAVPVHIIKTYRGSRAITPLILNLGARWR